MQLLDSDVAKKIALYTLVDELEHGVGCALTDFAVLPQLRYQLRLGSDKALARLGTPEAVAAAETLVANAGEVFLTPEAANYVLALNRRDIDTGEQLLFASILACPDDHLFTGDKRAMVAVAQIGGIDAIWMSLSCFEHLMVRIVDTHDFDAISVKVRARPDADMAMSLVFGRTAAAAPASVAEGLQSYLSALANDTGGKYIV